MIRFLTVMILGLHLTMPAQAISRVGKSSVGDDEEGFRARVPRQYVFARPFADGGLLLSNPSSHTADAQSSEIRFSRFRVDFPELAGLTREEIAEKMAEDRPAWTEVESVPVCALTFVYRGPELTAAFVTWGQGRGVVIATGASAIERRQLDAILASVELDGGTCAWN